VPEQPGFLEGLLRRAYGLAMTPLPGPGGLPDVGPLMAALRGMTLPGVRVGQLPQMPEAWRRYALQRGLMPGVAGAMAEPQVPAGYDRTTQVRI
jgi:hypothetical protein